MPGFQNPEVEQAFKSFSPTHRLHLLAIRDATYAMAASLDLPGGIEESLKWGEPSYVPVKPRTGSAIRLGCYDKQHVALYFNCQTTLVESFRARFGDAVTYSKNRAVLLSTTESLPRSIVDHCTAAALRYHLDKRSPR